MTYFSDLPIGAFFTHNGNECRKRSTRTADLLAYNRHFYFAGHDPVEPIKTFEAFTWFERDRQQVGLRTPGGYEVFCLNDEAVTEAVEDGFLEPPRSPRPSDADWLQPVINYALETGLLKACNANT
jgi:hypothetical protein